MLCDDDVAAAAVCFHINGIARVVALVATVPLCVVFLLACSSCPPGDFVGILHGELCGDGPWCDGTW